MHWFLGKCGMRGTRADTVNGLMLLVSYVLCRFLNMGVWVIPNLCLAIPHFYRDMRPWEWVPGTAGVGLLHCMSLHWLSLIASKAWKMLNGGGGKSS